MTEYVGSYDFDLRPGWAAFTIWRGPKTYRAILIVDRDKRYYRKEMRGSDLETLYYRAMAIISRYSRNPILVESSGRPLPVKVRTEDEEIREWAKAFVREHGIGKIFHPSVFLAKEYGPKHRVDIDHPENENGDRRRES